MSKRPVDAHDIVGKQFGRLIVKDVVSDEIVHGKTRLIKYLCECQCSDKTKRIVSRKDLLSGNTKSCGCLRREHTVMKSVVNKHNQSVKFLQLKDLSGNYHTVDLSGCRFGKLTVLSLSNAYRWGCNRVNTKWNCVCDCGNVCIVGGQALKSGHTVSCGCVMSEKPARLIDLTGRRFGQLVVIRRVGSRNHFAEWLCKCDCGNFRNVVSADLVCGNVISCGCLKRSKYEQFVIEYFNKMGLNEGIDYFCQYKYPDLRGVGGRMLSYDFILYRDKIPFCLIECQGEQHFHAVDYFGGDNSFLQQQEHDRRKREYANNIGLPLIEISYEYDTYDKVADYLNKNFFSI